MFIRLISDAAVGNPKPHLKKEIDGSIKGYHDSSYWNHHYPIFFEKSVAQTHAEAIKEWEIIGYAYNPEGPACAFHNNPTYNIYILRNKLNNNELQVGFDCAASHSLPAGFSEYSEASYQAQAGNLANVKETAIRAESRKYLETHHVSIADAIDTVEKYKQLSATDQTQLQSITGALIKLRQNYQGAKSSYEGLRENMIYWHKKEILRLDEPLTKIRRALPWLEKYPDFERVMRTLWNFRDSYELTVQKEIEETHIRWNRSPKNLSDVQITLADANTMMQHYAELMESGKVFETKISADGQLRLTLRYLYGYKALLQEETQSLFNFILDSLKFLQLRDPQIKSTQIELKIVRNSAEQKPKDLSPNKIHAQLIKMIDGYWEGTNVVLTKDVEVLEETLEEIRAARISRSEAKAIDPQIEEKINSLRTYVDILKADQKKQVKDLIKRWDSGTNYIYKQSLSVIETYYKQINKTVLTREKLEKRYPTQPPAYGMLETIRFATQCAQDGLITNLSTNMLKYTQTYYQLQPKMSISSYTTLVNDYLSCKALIDNHFTSDLEKQCAKLRQETTKLFNTGSGYNTFKLCKEINDPILVAKTIMETIQHYTTEINTNAAYFVGELYRNEKTTAIGELLAQQILDLDPEEQNTTTKALLVILYKTYQFTDESLLTKLAQIPDKRLLMMIPFPIRRFPIFTTTEAQNILIQSQKTLFELINPKDSLGLPSRDNRIPILNTVTDIIIAYGQLHQIMDSELRQQSIRGLISCFLYYSLEETQSQALTNALIDCYIFLPHETVLEMKEQLQQDYNHRTALTRGIQHFFSVLIAQKELRPMDIPLVQETIRLFAWNSSYGYTTYGDSRNAYYRLQDKLINYTQNHD